MRLRLLDRLRWLTHWFAGSRDTGHHQRRDSRAGGHRRSAGIPPRQPVPLQPPAGLPDWPAASGSGYTPGPPRNGAGSPGAAGAGGLGRARIREAPFGSAPVEALPEAPPPARPAVARQPWYQVVGGPDATRQATPQVRPLGPPPAALAHEAALANVARAAPAVPAARVPRDRRAELPFTAPRPEGHPPAADGRANCGPLEKILWRQWDESATPPAQVVAAIERLASFPRPLQEKLAAGLNGIYIGPGGVPELDHMTDLRGVPLPSGKATWDVCAGAYGEKKIVVGSRPSPTPDVVCHEVGHALDDLDSPPGRWQSDSAEFRLIYEQCQPYIASDFHRQRGGLGRKEFFADSFAAIASGQRPALVDMLSGNTRIALRVMLYFNRRYGI
jgi:hypothetical protein